MPELTVAHATMVMLCEAGAMAAAWSMPRTTLALRLAEHAKQR